MRGEIGQNRVEDSVRMIRAALCICVVAALAPTRRAFMQKSCAVIAAAPLVAMPDAARAGRLEDMRAAKAGGDDKPKAKKAKTGKKDATPAPAPAPEPAATTDAPAAEAPSSEGAAAPTEGTPAEAAAPEPALPAPAPASQASGDYRFKEVATSVPRGRIDERESENRSEN